jgi:hypothetical protein
MTPAAKIYLALAAAAALVWWAWSNRAIDPSVTEEGGTINLGSTP